MRLRQCNNKECPSHGQFYNVWDDRVCPGCKAENPSKGHSNIMVGLKAAEKGPLATYQPTGDFYMDQIFRNAQETLL